MSYYRLMAMWLADQAGGLRVPLPTPPPMEFSTMPEHFVEDMDDLLIYVSRRVPKAFEGANLVSPYSLGPMQLIVCYAAAFGVIYCD
jgi:ubiquitin conjugation factor E4 B